MSSQLMSFVSPITDHLESLQNQFVQLATLHRDAHARLRSQEESLINAGGLDAFIGGGAIAFSSAIDFYLSTSERHIQLLDEATSAAGTCVSEIIGAASYASSIYLNEGMVAHVLGQLTEDILIREGAGAIVAIIDDMRHTLDNMLNTGGNFFGHLFQGNIGGAYHDISQELAYMHSLYNEAISLLNEIEWVLSQWAHNISNAIGNCQHTIRQVADYLGTFLGVTTSGISQFKPVLKSLPIFKVLIPVLDSTKGQGILSILGVGLDFISGKKYTPRIFLGDTLGGGIGTVVGLTPPGRAAIIISGVIHLGGAGLAWGQNRLADAYGGTLSEELKKPAQDLQTASDNANLGAVFDDVGQVIVDTGGFGTPLAPTFFEINMIGGAFGVKISQPDQIGNDTQKLGSDLWNLINSPHQFEIGLIHMGVDDAVVLGNSSIQNLPLPDQVKRFSNKVTPGMIHGINDVSDFIMKNSFPLIGLPPF